MTNTPSFGKPAPLPLSLVATAALARGSGVTLVEQIVASVAASIDDRILRAGVRMPSIRHYASSRGVSRFTVVEAYDRLVAKGLLESRRGAGFFVREHTPISSTGRQTVEAGPTHPKLDVVWLVRNMFRQVPAQKMPGSGLLPNDWLDADLIGNALRAVGRGNQTPLLQYGAPQGFLPLRQQLQRKLAELEIGATPDQIVTTSGVTQALDLVARHFLQPGDTIFVDDPAWFLMFGSFSLLGARVIGIPRLSDGPDMAQLATLAALHKPRLYVINSVLHNPTSTSLSGAKAFQLLKLAELHDFMIVEDDIYGDMHAGGATRIAALDQLQRVIYLGGFSKTLAANLRVGFIAAAPALATQLADRKMLSTLTSTEIGERVVYKILSEGRYRKHIDRLRGKLDGVRDKTIRQLERIGVQVESTGGAGMFLWVDVGMDTNILTEKAMTEGYLLAPGCLFSPNQLPSLRMRINVATMGNAGVWRFLKRALGTPN